jgi:1,4-alpha-glucan branching enzyme
VEEKVSSYREFADCVLPRIKNAGYNVVQVMAI